MHNSLFLKILLLFLPMAALGTVTHEGGHWLVARGLGYDASLHYGWVSLGDVPPEARIWITLAGPLQTMLTGTVGLVWLWYLRRHGRFVFPLSLSAWAAILLTLFWSRQLFNAVSGVLLVLMGQPAVGGDELGIALYWHLPGWSVLTMTGTISLGVCLLVLYWFPAALRKTFLIAGISGSLLGFILWYGFLGPVLLP